MGLFDNTFSAFDPLSEKLEWRSARSAARGTFAASVFHAQSMSESTGASRGRIAADPWTVVVDNDDAIVASIKVGDKVVRLDRFDNELNVQQITRDADLGWILTCTANERSPK